MAKKKKETQIKACLRLEAKGKTVEEIAQQLGIKKQLVRSYLWRGHNPAEFKKMLEKYYAKRKAKKSAEVPTEEPTPTEETETPTEEAEAVSEEEPA